MNLSEKYRNLAQRAMAGVESLLEANPDGLTKEQMEQANSYAEDHTTYLAQAKTWDEKQVAAHADKEEEVIQDLVGMSGTGEVPGGDPDSLVSQGRNHSELLQQMARATTPAELPAGLSMQYKNYRAWKQHMVDGGDARSWVAQDLRVGTSSAGGNLVPTVIERSFFQVLEAVTGVIDAGARVFVTSGGNPISLPKVAHKTADIPANTLAGVQAATAEGATIGNKGFTTSTVTFNAYKYAGLNDISYEAMEDTAPDLESMIGMMLAENVGYQLNSVFTWGAGAGAAPEGILRSPEAQRTTQMATANTPTWQEILRLVGAIGNYAVGLGSAAHIMQKPAFYKIMETEADSKPVFLMAGNLDKPVKSIYGDPVVFSTFGGEFGTSGAYVDCYGHWPTAYTVRIVNGVRLVRDISAGFEEDVIKYKAVVRADGQFVNKQLVSWLQEA